MDGQVEVKIVKQLRIMSAPDRKDVAVVAIAVVGETAYYGIARNDLRKFAEGLLNAAEKLDTDAAKPN
jgi:hypothetical protein